MGHYLSEMMSDTDEQRERINKELEIERRAAAIQMQIDKKGLARFLAEMEINSFTHKVRVP